jgi:hypothetical protein
VTDSEAGDILAKLIDQTSGYTWENRIEFLEKTSYPKLAQIFDDYIHGRSIKSAFEFRNKAVEHIRLANTKLYKVMK